MTSATLTFTELETGELEMKMSFSGEHFDPSSIPHLCAAKAAELIGNVLDKGEDESSK